MILDSSKYFLNMVSVIVPVYNGEGYIRKCIDSIINQTYNNIEIIIIDDGSSDGTREICAAFACKDERIRIFFSNENNGPAAARNMGIKNARGEFMLFVDSDDYLAQGAVNLLMENHNLSKADIIIGDFKIIKPVVNPSEMAFLLPSSKLLTKQDIIDYTMDYLKKPTGYSLFIYPWGKLFKTSIAKNNNVYFNVDLQIFEDISFNFEYLKFVTSVYYVREHIYTYVVSNNYASQGGRIYDNPIGYKTALRNIEEFLKNENIDASIVKKEIGNAYVHFTISAMMRLFTCKREIHLGEIHKLILKIINDADIKRSLRFYFPAKGDSLILPILIKLKLVWLIILACQYKTKNKNKTHKKGAQSNVGR